MVGGVSVGTVAVEPITDADIDTVAEFLQHGLSSGRPAADWRQAMHPSWESAQPNRGYLLREGGRVVGAYLAYYSERMIDGLPRRICNLGPWSVDGEHRAAGLRMLRALLRQPGYTFTDLSPSVNVLALNTRLGFTALDTTTALVANLPWPMRSKGVRIIDSPNDIDDLLDGSEQRIYRDHAASAAYHAVITDGEQICYVMFRRERRKGLPLFASVLYVSNPGLFRDRARHFCRYLLLRRGLPATLLEGRVVGYRPRGSVTVAGYPKMFLSQDLDATQIDYLYSELTCRQW